MLCHQAVVSTYFQHCKIVARVSVELLNKSRCGDSQLLTLVVQADILVSIEPKPEPGQAAAYFHSSDGLTRQQAIEQLKEEYGRGVLKAGLVTLPPTTAILPPGMYTFKRSANQGEEDQIIKLAERSGRLEKAAFQKALGSFGSVCSPNQRTMFRGLVSLWRLQLTLLDE